MKTKHVKDPERSAVIEPGDGFEISETPVVIPGGASIDLYTEKSYTVPELAALINKSVTVTRRYIVAGRFPNNYKDGPFQSSKLRIPERDVAAYMTAVIEAEPEPATDNDAE